MSKKKTYQPSRRVFSAFVLSDDQTWEQPSFRVIGPRTEGAIAQALIEATRRAFVVYGLSEDHEAPECCVQLLDTANRKWVPK